MKISAVSTLTVFAQWRNWVLVKISTDEGLEGWGEATVEGREKAVAAAVQEVGRRIIGRHPLDIEALYQVMSRSSFWRGGVILGSAVSGLEQALWDLAGQHYGVPVYRLLGGPCRDKVRVYASGWIQPGDDTVDKLVSRARQTVNQGFQALKTPCFLPGEKTVDRGMLERGLDLVGELRSALGDEVEIIVELHGRFSFDLARQAVQRLQALDPAWIEEPCGPENVENLKLLAGESQCPIACGERLFTRHGFWPVIRDRAASVIQPDLCHAGGIWETRKVAAMAEVRDIAVAPHNPLSPLSTAACLHFAIATPNFLVLELVPKDVDWREQVFPETLYRFEDGHLHWRDVPGIGVTVDEEAAAEHPYQAVDLPVLKTADGAHADW
ncbi:MAG TPA: galactonate dehydratase [Acidobacteriota bacterium]|nr:galactonate dehydratase [Acidobacteriota bacterium]